MEKYHLTYRITGYASVDVEAASVDDAISEADSILVNTDFGELENIDWDASSPVDVS